MTVLDLSMSDGADIKVRRHGTPDRPPVLFCHGAGLASEGFRPFWQELLNSYQVFVMDLRGHGENGSCPLEGFSLTRLVQDFTQVVEELQPHCNGQPLNAVLHSMAAAVGLRVALLKPERFMSLVLYEPALSPPPGERLEIFEQLHAMAPPSTRRRRAVFDSPVQLQQLFLARGLRTRLDADAALLLARSLLRIRSDGRFELRCSPILEAAIYESVGHLSMWDDLRRLAGRVLIMGGYLDGSPEYTSMIAPVVSERGQFDLLRLPGLSHFGWLERPGPLARLTEAFIEGVRTAASEPTSTTAVSPPAGGVAMPC